MLVLIKENSHQMSVEAAQHVASQIKLKPDSVIGFATGSTPLGLYKELIRMHIEEGLDFSKVISFNLDEYIGIPPSHPESYHFFMMENLFKHININPSNIYIPMGMAENIELFCDWYEEKIKKYGGLDIQILGIGANGHIAFNEPGSSLGSRTRIKTLGEKTRLDNSRFFSNIDEVPKYAITMGVGTIMEAKKLLLLANGINKADAIKATVEGPIMAKYPATIVQLHRYATVIIDKEAASKLEGEYIDQ
jgi:glucosamine-6-phosphate deaminase